MSASTIIAASAVFSLTWVALAVMVRFAEHLPLDFPVARSLHARPIPCTGGMGMLAGIGPVAWWLDLRPLSPLLLLGLGLAVFSVLDDIKHLPVRLRLAVHLVAASAFMFSYAPPSAPFYLAGLLVLVVAWVINLYNFMDGADGLAAGMTCFGFGTYGVAAWAGGSPDLAAFSLLLAAAALAFLIFNFHPARIFMGDGGAIPLGFTAAALGLIGYWRGVWSPLFPFLVFSPFMVDASVTLLKRMLRGEKFWQAHKSHYYQRVVRMGLGHRNTALLAYLLMAACAVSGLAIERFPEYRWGVLGIWAFIYPALLLLIDHRWSRRVDPQSR